MVSQRSVEARRAGDLRKGHGGGLKRKGRKDWLAPKWRISLTGEGVRESFACL